MGSSPPLKDRRLLIAFDVETTFSIVSYSIVNVVVRPTPTPEILGVNRFPAQIRGNSRLPSVLWYDANGKARSIGTEALQDGMEEIAEESGWTKVSRFKLHLRPKLGAGTAKFISNMMPPLPKGMTVVDIFADLLRYLYQCTKRYIEDVHASGEMLWKSLQNQTHFILTRSNGHESFKQNQLKQAAVKAGLISDLEATNITFVTEGEAKLSYCIHNRPLKNLFKDNKGAIVVDAGDLTVDISAYTSSSLMDNKFEEIAAPQCHFKGFSFVTLQAEIFLKDHLRGSKYASSEYMERILKAFDKQTKLFFRRKEAPQFIKFGGLKDNDASKGIRSGQLRLAGTDVARFFAPSLECILDTISSMRVNSKKPISSVILVGGFSRSDYLFAETKKALRPFGIDVHRPDGRLGKAAADGAVIFCLNRYAGKLMDIPTHGHSCIARKELPKDESLSVGKNEELSIEERCSDADGKGASEDPGKRREERTAVDES